MEDKINEFSEFGGFGGLEKFDEFDDELDDEAEPTMADLAEIEAAGFDDGYNDGIYDGGALQGYGLSLNIEELSDEERGAYGLGYLNGFGMGEGQRDNGIDIIDLDVEDDNEDEDGIGIIDLDVEDDNDNSDWFLA